MKDVAPGKLRGAIVVGYGGGRAVIRIRDDVGRAVGIHRLLDLHVFRSRKARFSETMKKVFRAVDKH